MTRGTRLASDARRSFTVGVFSLDIEGKDTSTCLRCFMTRLFDGSLSAS